MGYPIGAPPNGYVPLLALLPRRLTEAEVRQVADEIGRRSSASNTPNDIAVSITRITDALPSEEDIARVKHHLETHQQTNGGDVSPELS